MATQDEYIKTALRLPRDLHKQVQDEAEARGRSMNAEIVARLQDTFDDGAAAHSALAVLALSGRLESDIAEARMESHERLEALAACAEPLTEVFRILKETGRKDDVWDLRPLEKVMEEYNFSEAWLKKQRLSLEEQLQRAKIQAKFAERQIELPGFPPVESKSE